MEQLARNLTDSVEGCLRTASHLIHDRDPLYTRVFGEILTSGGVQPIRLPPKSPNLNAYAERFVRSIKEECLSRVVPLGEAPVRQLVHEFVEHYHHERNHQGATTNSCNDRHLRSTRTPTLSGGSASADFSASTTERPHEGAADYLHLTPAAWAGPMRSDTGLVA